MGTKDSHGPRGPLGPDLVMAPFPCCAPLSNHLDTEVWGCGEHIPTWKPPVAHSPSPSPTCFLCGSNECLIPDSLSSGAALPTAPAVPRRSARLCPHSEAENRLHTACTSPSMPWDGHAGPSHAGPCCGGSTHAASQAGAPQRTAPPQQATASVPWAWLPPALWDSQLDKSTAQNPQEPRRGCGQEHTGVPWKKGERARDGQSPGQSHSWPGSQPQLVPLGTAAPANQHMGVPAGGTSQLLTFQAKDATSSTVQRTGLQPAHRP